MSRRIVLFGVDPHVAVEKAAARTEFRERFHALLTELRAAMADLDAEPAEKSTVVPVRLDARQRLRELVEELRRAHPDLSAHDCLRLALSTPEGRELYETMTSTDPAVTAASVLVEETSKSATDRVAIRKKEGEDTMTINKSMKELAWEEIRERAIAQYPTLTEAQAITKFALDPTNCELIALHRDPDAHLPARAFAERKAVSKRRGFESWSAAFAAEAQAIAGRGNVDFTAALRKAAGAFPDTFTMYQREAQGLA